MTEKQKQAIELRLAGYSLEAIGQMMGCSRQNAEQFIFNGMASVNIGRKRRAIKCAYPRIRDYLSENDIALRDFCKESGVTYACMLRVLAGRNKPSLNTAILVAQAIGAPVEEVWAEERDAD